jgi:hypothetical protein
MSRDVRADVPNDQELERMRHQKRRSLKLGKKMITRVYKKHGNTYCNFLNLASGQANGSKIPENQVVVTSASLESVSMGNRGLGQSASVGNNLLGIRLKLGLCNLEESSGDGGDSLQ